MRKIIASLLAGSVLALGSQTASAVAVDLELILATDVSGSVDAADFAARRSGIEAAFRSGSVINAIESGTIGKIAVSLWDFASSSSVAVGWTLISDGASSNAFADLVAAATRGSVGSNDGQSAMIDAALAALNTNGYEGRSVLDINSEGAQDIDGCSFNVVNCTAVQNARAAFLAGGGDAINAIWMNDRDFFGLDASDLINAFEYGSLNVVGGTGSFQVFAATNEDYVSAIQSKIIREITPVPEPGSLALLGIGLGGLASLRRRKE